MDGHARDLPCFAEEGLLPAQDFELSLNELRDSLLVVGPYALGQTDDEYFQGWDHEWRLLLVNNLALLVEQLWQVDVTEIFVDGSFVEDKLHPNDIDGYFECEPRQFFSGALERDLNEVDPHQCWTWDTEARRPYRGYPKGQLPMWHRYRVEFYPHYGFGPGTGIQDEFGNDQRFPAAFRKSRREHKPHGIVKIVH